MRRPTELKEAVQLFLRVPSRSGSMTLNLTDIDDVHPVVYIHPRRVDTASGSSICTLQTNLKRAEDVPLIPHYINYNNGTMSVRNVEEGFIRASKNYEKCLIPYQAGNILFYGCQGLILRDDLSVVCMTEACIAGYDNRQRGIIITFDTGVLRYPNLGINRFFSHKLVPYLCGLEWLDRNNYGICFANLEKAVVNSPINRYVPKQTIVARADKFLSPYANININFTSEADTPF